MRRSIHIARLLLYFFFFFNDPATTEIYTLSLHDALPICRGAAEVADEQQDLGDLQRQEHAEHRHRSEEHTSELQSLRHLVCRLLLEKKKKKKKNKYKKKKCKIKEHKTGDDTEKSY